MLRQAPARAEVAGHFGEWIQGRLGPVGPVVLVTVPCPAFRMDATFDPSGTLTIKSSEHAMLSLRRAQALLKQLRARPGAVAFSGNMTAARGTGASTAMLVALARAAGVTDPMTIAHACVAVEGASDPLMMPNPDQILWAPRLPAELERLPRPPRCEVIGGFFGKAEATDPSDDRFPDISDVLARWRQAVQRGDLAGLAQCATASAVRTTHLRGPADDPTGRVAADVGALGWLRAHTGSARGLIFPEGGVPRHARHALRDAGLTDVIQFTTGTLV